MRQRKGSIALLASASVFAMLLLAPAAWAASTVRLTASKKKISDSHSENWTPARGRLNGKRFTIMRTPSGTASPKLYYRVAIGSTHLRLRLPGSGRYAITLYTVDPALKPRGRSSFDVYRGKTRVLKDAAVLRGTSKLSAPLQNSFETNVKGRRLNLSFKRRRGRVAIAAVMATKLEGGAARPLRPILTDEFNGPAGTSPNRATWNIRTGFGWGSAAVRELQTYTDQPQNVALDGKGQLTITARRGPFLDGAGNPVFKDSAGATGQFTSGRIENTSDVNLAHARIQARIKVPAGRGFWPAMFAIGAPPAVWPDGGEIDVLEMIGQDPNTLHGFVHGRDRTPGNVVTQNEAKIVSRQSLASKLHNYEIRTYPDTVEFFLDGRRYGSVARADINRLAEWPLDKPFRLALALAVGGWPGPPNASTPFPASMTVDYLRISG